MATVTFRELPVTNMRAVEMVEGPVYCAHGHRPTQMEGYLQGDGTRWHCPTCRAVIYIFHGDVPQWARPRTSKGN